MEIKQHILIVDDDNRICKLLKQFFIREGYLVSTAHNVKEAEQQISLFIFDLIILDVMLPGITGLDFAKTLKQHTDNAENIPVILLTALGEAEHRIAGLETGADDYLVKPIEPRELLLRAKKLIELYGQNKNNNVAYFGNNIFDKVTKELIRKDEVINLTTSDIKLLEMFLNSQGEVVSRENLAGFMGGLSERSVDVAIVRLRGKIEDDPKNPRHLQTIRNEGYVFYF